MRHSLGARPNVSTRPVKSDVTRQLPGADELRRLALAVAFAALVLVAGLWSVAPTASATSHQCTPYQSSEALIRDCETLWDLRDELDPEQRLTWGYWLDLDDLEWEGVSANSEDGVTHLYLTNKQLTGSIPAALANLPNLRTLQLGGNALSGTIPDSFGDYVDSTDTSKGRTLQKLRVLYLWGSNFPEKHPDYSTYNIPDEFGYIETIVHPTTQDCETDQQGTSVCKSPLGGTIPDSLGNLTSLQELRLDSNRFSGSIPDSFTNLTELRMLQLSNNQFSGPLPTNLGNLTKLESFSVSRNSLSGGIPTSISNLTKMLYLGMDGNSFSGNIPNFSRMTLLDSLHLGSNHLEGTIPSSLGTLNALHTLGLADNRLYGSIPSSLGSLSQLQFLDLSRQFNPTRKTGLTGAVPSSLGNLAKLEYLVLEYNSLDGTIPVQLRNLTSLIQLRLNDNELDRLGAGLFDVNAIDLGESGAYGFRSLKDASFNNNTILGKLPDALGNLKVNYLNLSENGFDGSIPAALGDLENVKWLGLSCNSLSGDIPESLGAITTLRYLFLNQNPGLNLADAPSNLEDGSVVANRVVWLNEETPCTPIDDETAPVLQSVEALTTEVSAGVYETKIVLEYDEVLHHTHYPAADVFTIWVDGEEQDSASGSWRVNTVSVVGETIELLLASPLQVLQVAEVAYSEPSEVLEKQTNKAIQDRAGNDADGIARSDRFNPVTTNGGVPDNERPTLVQDGVAMADDGRKIVLTFSEILHSANRPPVSTFTVTVDSVEQNSSGPWRVRSVSIPSDSRTVELNLNVPSQGAIQEGQNVTIEYTAPGDDDTTSNDAIQDRVGNDALDFGPEDVANDRGEGGATDNLGPEPEEAVTEDSGSTIAITFNEILHGDVGQWPPGTAFTVTVDPDTGVEKTPNAQVTSIDGTTLKLSLSGVGSPVRETQDVTVAYAAPQPADNQSTTNQAVQDRLGWDALDFDADVDNDAGGGGAADAQGPSPTGAETADTGRKIVVSFDEVLFSPRGPPASAFTVSVDGVEQDADGAWRVTGATVPSSPPVKTNTVELRLHSAIRQGQVVTVAYSAPADDDTTSNNAIQDRLGNDAGNFSRSVAHVDSFVDNTPPGLDRAEMPAAGDRIILTFNEILHSGSGPATSDFSVAVDKDTAVEQARTVTNVAISGATIVLSLSSDVLERRAVTVTYTAPSPKQNEVSTNPAIQDRAGNDAVGFTDTVVTNNSRVEDNVDPFITGAKTPDEGDNAGDGDRIQLIYSEVLDHNNGPAGTDFVVKVDEQSVSLAGSNSVTVSGATVELRLASAVREGQEITVSYYDPTSGNDPNAIQDRVGRDANTEEDYPVTNNSAVADGMPPGLLHAEIPAAGDRIILTFDEFLHSANGPARTDFAVAVDKDTAVEQTRTVTSLTISDATVVLYLNSDILERRAVTVTYTKPADNNALTNAAIQDRVGNDANGFTDHLVTNNSRYQDFAAPYITDAKTPDEGAHDGAGDRIWLIYSEVLDSESGPVATDFVVKVDKKSIPLAGTNPVTVRGATVELRLAEAVLELQEITVSYYDPTSGNDLEAIQDRVGRDANTVEDYPVQNNSTVEDNTPPGLDRAEMPRAGDRVVLTFDEVLDSTDGPAADGTDFEVKVDGQAVQLAQGSPVTVSDRTVEVLLASAVAEDKAVTITYSDPTGDDDTNAIQDREGNDANTFTDRPVTRLSGVVDNTPPSFSSAKTPDNGDGDRIILTFDEDLDSANGPENDDFLVRVAGEERTTEEQVVISGATIELTLTSDVTANQPITVTYGDPSSVNDPNAIQDAAGNDADSFSNREVSNQSTQTEDIAPSFVSAEMPKEGDRIILTFTEPLDTEYPPPSNQFTVTVDKGTTAEETRGVESDVIVTGRTVVLNLDASVREKRSVVVSYEDLTGNEVYAIQDYGGNDAASFTDKVVTNNSRVRDGVAPKLHPTLENAKTSEDGERIVLTFDEVLDGANGPADDDFVVRVVGEDRAIDSQIVMNGATIELTLQSVVTVDQEISVTYTDPTSGNDAEAIQDRAGNDAETFTADVANNSTQTESIAPTFEDAATSEDGSRVILTFSEVLDSANGPMDDDFVVKVGDEVRSIEPDVDVSGRTVVLTVSIPVTPDDVIKVSYTDPTEDFDDFQAIQDHGGQRRGQLRGQSCRQ